MADSPLSALIDRAERVTARLIAHGKPDVTMSVKTMGVRDPETGEVTNKVARHLDIQVSPPILIRALELYCDELDAPKEEAPFPTAGAVSA